MPDSREAIIRMYDSALRALDTKAQIFLAFLTLTMTPVFTRLADLGTGPTMRLAEGGLFIAASGAFVYCLYPRRGKVKEPGLFHTGIDGGAIVTLLERSGNDYDSSATIAALHDIYRLKARSVAIGIVLVAIYLLTLAATLVLV